MTPAARRSMIAVARKCAAGNSWTPLCGWVENYAERARSPAERDPRCIRQPDGTQVMPVGQRPALPLHAPTWWQRNRAAVIALGAVAVIVGGLILAAMP